MNRQLVDINIGFVRGFLLALVLIAVSDPAAAQEVGQEVAGLQQRVAELEAVIDSLRTEYGSRLAALEQESATRPRPGVAEQAGDDAVDEE